MTKTAPWIMIALFYCGLSQNAWSEDTCKVLAVGDWSKPVSDNRGYTLRGRLVLCEKPTANNLRETPLYIEIQDAGDFVGNGMRLYCEMAKHDFRPEYKGGLNCELRNPEGKLVESQSFPFGGATPKSEWVTLPTDATIRLRATPFGIRREKVISICPHLGQLWVIGADDPKVYELSGSFTINPMEKDDLDKLHAWCGTLDLPAVRIGNRLHANELNCLPDPEAAMKYIRREFNVPVSRIDEKTVGVIWESGAESKFEKLKILLQSDFGVEAVISAKE